LINHPSLAELFLLVELLDLGDLNILERQFVLVEIRSGRRALDLRDPVDGPLVLFVILAVNLGPLGPSERLDRGCLAVVLTLVYGLPVQGAASVLQLLVLPYVHLGESFLTPLQPGRNRLLLQLRDLLLRIAASLDFLFAGDLSCERNFLVGLIGR